MAESEFCLIFTLKFNRLDLSFFIPDNEVIQERRLQEVEQNNMLHEWGLEAIKCEQW